VHYQEEEDKVKNAEADEAKRKKKAIEDRDDQRDWYSSSRVQSYTSL